MTFISTAFTRRRVSAFYLTVLAGVSLSSRAASIAISFADNGGEFTNSGTTWNAGTSSASPNYADLTDTSGVSSGVSLSTSNGGGFGSDSRGEGVDFTFNGILFPGRANDGYIADNFDGGSRDGLMQFTFTAPNTFEFAVWEFTILTSVAGGGSDNDLSTNQQSAGFGTTHYNVGGTYSSVSRTFSGGTTVIADAADDVDSNGDSVIDYDLDAVTLTANAIDTGSNYLITLQVGYPTLGDNNNVAAINALYINTMAIPEPSSLLLMSLALGFLMIIRRKGRR